MTPFFTPDDIKVAYQSRFHFGWYAHGRGVFTPVIRSTMESTLKSVAERMSYHVLEVEIEPSAIRALISLRPEVAPADVSRFIKGNIATAVRREHGVSNLWSRGWFVRSVGDVTNDTVRNYVAAQYDERNSPAGDISRTWVARHVREGDSSQLRASNHGQFEYNVHVVMVTDRRRELLDMEVAEALVEYLRRVCDSKGWVAWDIQVVWNHVHLFLGLSSIDAPGEAALSLLNNAEYFLQQRYGAMFARDVSNTVLQPGYYVGTVGSATTAQVNAHLSGR